MINRKRKQTDVVTARAKLSTQQQIPESLMSSSPGSSSAPSTNSTLTQSLEAGFNFAFTNDIGQFVSKAVSPGDRYDILNNWIPPISYSFPSLRFGQHNRSFQRQWLEEFKWLAYSDALGGAFCKWCIAFAPKTVTRSVQSPGALVSSPHSNYKKAREYYIKHQSCSYHQLASTLFENFIHTSQNPENDIQNVLARNRLKKIKENRKRMHHIITWIEFCGRQELPLRGHRDSGPFLHIASEYNEDVFRAALRLRLKCSDKVTLDLFWNAPRNASYLSWKVQNDIISIMGSKIQKQIVSDVSKNKFFSILADETSDLSQTEQFSTSVRFVKKYTIHEEFLCFVPVSSTSRNLTNVILLELR